MLGLRSSSFLFPSALRGLVNLPLACVEYHGLCMQGKIFNIALIQYGEPRTTAQISNNLSRAVAACCLREPSCRLFR